jgi:hypothetical protein
MRNIPPETRSRPHLDPPRARLGQHLPVAQPFADGGLVVAALAVGEAVAHGGLGVEHPEQAALVLTAQGNLRTMVLGLAAKSRLLNHG